MLDRQESCGAKMDTQDASGPLVYYDTNVLAYINSGDVPDFLSSIAGAHGRHVVSDTVVEELPDGAETAILLRHRFLYLISHEAAFPEGTVNFYNSLSPSKEAANTDALELFLGAWLRSSAGSNSVPDLRLLFRDGMHEVLESIMEDLPDGTDPRLIAQLEQARSQLFSGLADLSDVTNPIVSREEMESHSFGPKFLGNIKPPLVVKKIIQQYPDAADCLGNLIVSLRTSEDIKARIQELCAALVMIGFARDRRIVKDDPLKSENGTRAQFRDISHICSAAVCNVFVTADRRCAKLAYAVYEALGLRKEVLHLTLSGKDEVKIDLVGDGYWP